MSLFRPTSNQNNNNNVNIKNVTDNKAAATATKSVAGAKEILGEAADAVANSFAKNSNNQQGMNKGRHRGTDIY